MNGKGFELHSSRTHHLRFFLHDEEGRRTPVHTEMSSGSGHKSIIPDLFSKMVKDIHLRAKKFRQYLDCDYDYPEFLKDLRKWGKIPPLCKE